MRGSELRKARPFVEAVGELRRVTTLDFASCACVLVEGRWRMSSSCKRRDVPCRTAVTVAVRTDLRSMRLGADHVGDGDLPRLVGDLHSLTLDLPRISVEVFQRRMHEVFRVPMPGEAEPDDAGVDYVEEVGP